MFQNEKRSIRKGNAMKLFLASSYKQVGKTDGNQIGDKEVILKYSATSKNMTKLISTLRIFIYVSNNVDLNFLNLSNEETSQILN